MMRIEYWVVGLSIDNGVYMNKKKISILIIENNSELRTLLIESIKDLVDEIYEAKDGLEAWNIYKEYKPNIILSDINVPKINGLELIERIRKEDRDTQIIILSAYTNIEYLQKAIELHLISYLIKPVASSKLKKAINKAIYEIKSKYPIELSNQYFWSEYNNSLYYKNREKIVLSHYESKLIKCLIESKGKAVSYIDMHIFIYDEKEYSRDAIAGLVKRIRKKTSKDIIESCFKEGYKIK